ncbi:MAG: Holliday junction DNA helicase RuvA [Candidatus Liptonbacteria bacterium RIFCSPHIGHO2_01_FULL_57_28]|uniref:Holliday junction branch migration complex subunit RuvA n=1 Tax=Candidatus Liptonbacteria bacterium RIFCSPHIGHO2_01_FULL_57_28 TaxID=1798647 RepID=A0A1G2CC64_9BACT|nr:MAG: Holliday junction DNA helicase RuvA [Candidatus Liptonbacteria bacterium RIFCSPHIGHO2_01_FULL_57_28]
MIYSVKGPVATISEGFAVVEVGGLGLKAHMSDRGLKRLKQGTETYLFCHLHVREDALDLYGFQSPEELEFFELLLTIAGVGPRSALAILDVAELAELGAAIQEGRPDLLTKASGIGRKTAERIVLELKDKIHLGGAEEMVKKMEGDSDLVETLVGLGYRRDQAKSALEKISKDVKGLEARLREALKVLGKR